jgi:hypothetical protein
MKAIGDFLIVFLQISWPSELSWVQNYSSLCSIEVMIILGLDLLLDQVEIWLC